MQIEMNEDSVWGLAWTLLAVVVITIICCGSSCEVKTHAKRMEVCKEVLTNPNVPESSKLLLSRDACKAQGASN